MFRWRVEFTIQQDGKAGDVVVVVAATCNYLALAKAGIHAGHSFGINPDSVISVRALPERGGYE